MLVECLTCEAYQGCCCWFEFTFDVLRQFAKAMLINYVNGSPSIHVEYAQLYEAMTAAIMTGSANGMKTRLIVSCKCDLLVHQGIGDAGSSGHCFCYARGLSGTCIITFCPFGFYLEVGVACSRLMKIQDQALEMPSEYPRPRLDSSGTPSESWRQRLD
ncbi:hypothetical protein Tco_0749442 [Tanacetum coccineum]|uniref:Uncharacterized protein n=1 Tax=Tanacetum coccineum TaxID=301880 RepID=A0ABQ4YZQ1_9ASTR